MQGLIKKVNSLISSESKIRTTIFTKKFAGQFRDYLISSLCINNGLRPSNIIALRLKDFKEAKDLPGYPGHKVLTNEKYKTSTIYSEKVIVVSKMLYDHYTFYKDHLRLMVSNVKSGRVFLPGGREGKFCVSSSLTESFKLAKVFSKKDLPRVSCTRIRCGIATYACNEGGFDESYFAKHFMKNRQETTALHYNLLSNQRHALAIAMNLYNTFSIAGKEIVVKKEEIANVAADIQDSFHLVKEEVLQWINKKNPDISKKELEEFRDMLDSIQKSNCATFYGGEMVNKM